MSRAAWGIGIGIGAIVGIGGAVILLRRSVVIAGTGDLEGRVGALEGRVDDLDSRLTDGLRMISSYGTRLEVLERRGPQTQYVFQQAQVPIQPSAPPAPPRRQQAAPPALPMSTMAGPEDLDPAVRRFQLLEYD